MIYITLKLCINGNNAFFPICLLSGGKYMHACETSNDFHWQRFCKRKRHMHLVNNAKPDNQSKS